jgi:hypothetical protein
VCFPRCFSRSLEERVCRGALNPAGGIAIGEDGRAVQLKGVLETVLYYSSGEEEELARIADGDLRPKS